MHYLLRLTLVSLVSAASFALQASASGRRHVRNVFDGLVFVHIHESPSFGGRCAGLGPVLIRGRGFHALRRFGYFEDVCAKVS